MLSTVLCELQLTVTTCRTKFNVVNVALFTIKGILIHNKTCIYMYIKRKIKSMSLLKLNAVELSIS